MSAPNHGSKVQPISVPLGALCREEPVFIAGSASGPLSGLRFVAKDVFDVEGRVTGAGNPDWRRTHSPAACTATAIRLLVDAGAELAGMALTEELQFSLTGENPHYGTPRNVKAPGRIPGGSSSGSAAVVGAGLAPFALGADSGGSVRVPAALCGVHGMRPTHGAVPISGCLPLGPSFDTVGWFGVDARTLERVGDVLLSEPAPYERRAPRRLVVLADAFAIAEPSTQVAVRDAAARLALLFEEVEETALAPPGKLESWRAAVRTLQGAEIWMEHGDWVRSVKPTLGPDVQLRFDWASAIDPAAVDKARKIRERARARAESLLGARDTIVALPTVPAPAIPCGSNRETIEAFRDATFALCCFAGLAGLPQLTIPLRGADGLPLGLSIIGARGADRMLMAVARRFEAETTHVA